MLFKIVIMVGALWITPDGVQHEKIATDIMPARSYASIQECREALKGHAVFGFIGSRIEQFVNDSDLNGNTLRAERARVKCVAAPVDVEALIAEGF